IHAAIVIARYCIIMYPVSFLLVAKGLHACLSRLQTLAGLGESPWGAVLHGLVPVGFATTLFLSGPLPQQYEKTSNFINHSAYQHAYGLIDWGRTYVSEMKPPELKTETNIRLQELSPFYHRLRMDQGARRIVEFPMMIGDHFNPYYYYQHFHEKQVLIGYDKDCPELLKLMPGGVYANSYVDEVLSRVADRRQIRFRTMVDMADIDALRRSGADYVVLHTRFEADLSRIALPNPNIGSMCRLYAQYFGPPYYEDNHLVVFKLPGGTVNRP
ncbi:MAG TPA: hypothetical protein VFF53_01335, partial [Geobacteraceae bacterium]|nr:hypothetical protein [Geobacteraceae bacterium]